MNANGNVRVGEPFKPNATVWNSLVSMKRRALDNPSSVGATGSRDKGLTVLVKNGLSALEAGTAVGIGEVVIAPESGTIAEWASKQVYNVATPVPNKPWGVIRVPAAANTILPVCLSGNVSAKVTMSDSTHRFAKISASGSLISGPFGDARILWFEPEPGSPHVAGTPWDAWCLLSMKDSKERSDVPAGYIRLYRGSNNDTINFGRWYWTGTSVVLDANGEFLGCEYSATGTAGTNPICVPLTDMPNPYSGTLPSEMAAEDRTDYVIASVGGMALIHNGGDPYIVPAGISNHEFVSKTIAGIMTLAAKTNPSAEETFQLENTWCMANASYGFKISPPTGLGPSLELDAFNRIGVVGTPSAPAAGNATVFCFLGSELGYGWTTISTSGGSSSEEYTGADSISISEEKVISLVGDGGDASGLYYADVNGEVPTRGFVDFDGSLCIDETAGTLQLEGDSEAPSTGTDQLLYVYDRSPAADADKKRRWIKIGSNGGLKAETLAGSEGLRLAGTSATAPSVGSVWGCVGTSSYGWIAPCTLTINA